MTIKSMTGYGGAKGVVEGLNITADNVRVVADLSDYDATTGVITVTAKAYVDGYEKAGAIGEYTVSVSLTNGG